jgi:exopolysaccharide biosynthesis polyprenyl glycosylphosphotransferase
LFAGELQRQKALLATTDAISVAGGVVLAWLLRSCGICLPGSAASSEMPAGLIVLVFIWMLTARASGLYRLRYGRLREFLAIGKVSATAWLLVLTLSFFAHLAPSRLVVGVALLLTVVLVFASRTLVRGCISFFYSHPAVSVPLVIVGTNSFGRVLRDQITEELTQYEFLGFVDEAPAASGQSGPQLPAGLQLLGGLDQIASLAAAHPHLEVAIALPDGDRSQLDRIVELCERHRIRWRFMPWIGKPPMTLKVEMFGAIPLIGPRGSNIEGLNYIMKRSVDILLAALLLLVASPILVLAAIAIWLFDERPLLFRQTRIGIHGRPFELLKLRTMGTQSSDQVHREYVKGWIHRSGAIPISANGNGVYKICDDQRVTRVGRWLRRFSIDELPQLINVLRGDMSLIGPRPAMPYELDLYQDWHRHRLDAPPGITGLWQVNGRNRLSFEEMVQLDIEYIEDWSLTNDVKILLRTLPVILRGSGH